MAKKTEKKQEVSLDDLMALITSGPSAQATETLLGVPAGYVATRPDASGRVQAVQPIYKDGDQLIPRAWDAARVEELQRKLVAAGLLEKGTKFRRGVFDDASVRAYTRLLEYANGAGLDERDAITAYAQGYEEENSQPLTIRVSNPAELRETFDAVSRTLRGRKMTPEWIDGAVRAFQAQEENYQRAVGAGTGGTFVAPPSAETYAMSEIRQDDPAGVGANDFLGNANAFFDLIKETA